MNVIPNWKRCACWVPALALLVGQAVIVNGQTVLVDFGNDTTYRSLSVLNPDTKGHYWNSIQPGVLVENFVDLQNNATTIDIGWDTPLGFDSFNGPAGPTGPADVKADLRANDLPFTDIDLSPTSALGNLNGALEGPFDFVTGQGVEGANQVRFQIQQLDPAKKYNLTFFGSHIFSNDTTTVYTVFTNNTYTTPVGTANLDVQVAGMPNVHNKDKVATINNLSPQADNILYVQFVGMNGNLGYLNCMQIEAVTPAGTAGDYNNNGTVDAADYAVWRNNVGTTTTLPNDPTGGTIGTTQYDTWRRNFGLGIGSGSGLAASAAVPEPAALVLVVAGMLGLPFVGRWR
jgi:hypothetical protein